MNNDMPMVCVKVHINEEKKIEEVEFVEQFASGDYGEELNQNSDYYSEYALECILNDVEPDTLYHVYLNFNYYSYSTCDGTEYDMDTNVLQIIPLIHNYRNYLDIQEEYERQRMLANKQQVIEDITIDGNGWCESLFRPQMTVDEFEKMIPIIAEKDIRLAHRVCCKHNETITKELLGNNFDENIMNIEKKRNDFRQYIRYNNDKLNMSYDNDHYHFKPEHIIEFPKEFDLTYEEINNIPDEILIQYEDKELLKTYIDSREVMRTLVECNKEVQNE